MGTGKWRQEREVRSTHHAKPPTDGARPARALGTIRSPQGHWEPPGRALGKELQSDKEVWGSWETNPHFPSPLWGKMVLEGRLALTPSCGPFFLGFASLPGCCCHLLQEVFTDALSLGKASFPDVPIIPIPDSNDTLYLFGSVP